MRQELNGRRSSHRILREVQLSIKPAIAIQSSRRRSQAPEDYVSRSRRQTMEEHVEEHGRRCGNTAAGLYSFRLRTDDKSTSISYKVPPYRQTTQLEELMPIRQASLSPHQHSRSRRGSLSLSLEPLSSSGDLKVHHKKPSYSETQHHLAILNSGCTSPAKRKAE
jgi:hypothetical protein